MREYHPGIVVEALASRILMFKAAELLEADTSQITDFGWSRGLLRNGGVLLSVIRCPS